MQASNKRYSYIILGIILSCSMLACSPIKKMRSYQKSITELTVSKQVKINCNKVWPLTLTGTYVQQVTTSFNNKDYGFSVLLKIEKFKLEAIAFDELYGRLYHLIWTPAKLQLTASPYIPTLVAPEKILADFLLLYLPIPTLQAVLVKATVSENNGTILITDQANTIVTISRNKPLKHLWKEVMINNLQDKYTLKINTVVN